ncbi:MAG: PSD1 domain-containing protein [Verrucomicrobia bacterium]|nr:PSD1 domain-containing protein [Verrucomicrobiota bacterium]
MKSLAAILALAGPLLVRGADAPSAEGARFFEEEVRPILEQRCFECHSHQSGKMKNGLTLDSRNGWATGGDSGPALVPGEPEKSLLIKAVRRTDPELKMPPKQALTETEVAVLEEWVRRGAPDPRETEAAAATGAAKPDAEWWSLKPLVRPAVPRLAAHPIDAFVTAKLRDPSITPAPEADRRTLIRRLTLDLHGMLPTPEEVDSFAHDAGPQAYEKLVERLLAAPRYGERWARHWLDAIHFADTHGFEHDLIRTNAWRYRDYVIESLNCDTPWPRFIREQLAADAFFPDEPRLTVALGFIAAGPFDQSTASTAPKMFDYLDRDDMVTQTMSTFASATVHCARCHDHKFDPITQADYYALQAVFAGVSKGNVAFDEDLPRHRQRRRWRQLLAAAEKEDRAVLFASENEPLIAAWEARPNTDAVWETLHLDVFLTAGPATLKRAEDGSLLAEGPRPETDTYTLTATTKLGEVTALRLEVLADPALPMKGPGRQDNGNLHLSEFEVRVFQPGAAQGDKVAIRRATADFDQSGWTISHALDGNEKTAWGIHPRVGESHLAVFELQKKLTLTNGARLTFQLKQLHGQGHLIGKFRLAATGDDAARVSVIPVAVAEARRLAREQRSEAQRLAVAAYALRIAAEDGLAALPPPLQVFAGGPDFVSLTEDGSYKPGREPKVVHVLNRGDFAKPGAPAAPGALTAIAALPGRFALKNPTDEAGRRAALADWLADAKNPLTWRSIVNRIWHHHFGRGLSDSPNDLGRMGSLPTHPELLDWLACEFRDHGGSLKALHRLIVTSAVYRRAARHDEAAAARDPENRLLWRRPSQRLDAESYRDAVLAVSGRLDLTMGGPGVQHFKLGKPIQLTPTVDYAPFDWDSPGAGRRSIYRFVYRCLQDPFMDALDFPDAAQLAPTRPFSASALQALALLNDDFVLHHSQWFATRLEKLGATPEERTRAAFRLAFQRAPTPGEQADFTAYAAQRGLAAMCRLLLNSNEFFFIN